jgi:ankyrin repeat protein
MSTASQSDQHREWVSNAIGTNSLALLRTCKERGIAIRACCAALSGTDKSIVFAALLGNAQAIRTLCELGADVNTRDKIGGTPVWAAAQKGYIEIIRGLCQLGGADVNLPTHTGCTPVFAAAQNGHANAIRVLCNLGADIKTPDVSGSTPVYIAAGFGHAKAIPPALRAGG